MAIHLFEVIAGLVADWFLAGIGSEIDQRRIRIGRFVLTVVVFSTCMIVLVGWGEKMPVWLATLLGVAFFVLLVPVIAVPFVFRKK